MTTNAVGESSGLATRNDSVWSEKFDEETRRQQLDEDSFAWRSVTGLLMAIILVGVLIAIFAVTFAN